MSTGKEIPNQQGNVKFKINPKAENLRVLDMKDFVNKINDKLQSKKQKVIHSGQLAIELIEGVPRLEVTVPVK